MVVVEARWVGGGGEEGEEEEGEEGEEGVVVGKMWRDLMREERMRRREVGGSEMWKMEYSFRAAVAASSVSWAPPPPPPPVVVTGVVRFGIKDAGS